MSTTLEQHLARDRFSGTVLAPDEPGYDEARAVHNGLIDKRPAVIVRCRTADDVVGALELARGAGLEVSVRGGGHNVAGRAVTDGGVMIDLAEMKSVVVDPEQATATAQGGVTWAELNEVTGTHGLAVTGGLVSTTGIAGLTLGGGLGWLMGKHGLAADNLLEGRGGDRRRRGAAGRRVRTPTSSGRCAAAAATSASSRRSRSGCTPSRWYRRADRPSVRGRGRSPALLPRRRRRRVGRADGVRRPRARSGRLGRQARGARRLPRRDAGDRRARPGAVQGLRIAADDRDRPAAIPGDEHPARRRLPRRRAQLLAVQLRPRPDRRADRHRDRALRDGSVSDDRDPVRALPWRRHPHRAARDRVPHREPGWNVLIPSVWTDPAATDANIDWTRATFARCNPNWPPAAG